MDEAPAIGRHGDISPGCIYESRNSKIINYFGKSKRAAAVRRWRGSPKPCLGHAFHY